MEGKDEEEENEELKVVSEGKEISGEGAKSNDKKKSSKSR